MLHCKKNKRRFKMKTKDLTQALQVLKDQAAYARVQASTEDETISLTTHDVFIVLSYPDGYDFDVVLNVKAALAALKRLSVDVCLAPEGNHLIASDGITSICLWDQEYGITPFNNIDTTNPCLDIQSNQFFRAIKAVIPACDNKKEDFNKIFFFTLDDRLFIAACDSFRLLTYKISYASIFFTFVPFSIPSKLAKFMTSFFEKDKDVGVCFGDNSACFYYKSKKIIVRTNSKDVDQGIRYRAILKKINHDPIMVWRIDEVLPFLKSVKHLSYVDVTVKDGSMVFSYDDDQQTVKKDIPLIPSEEQPIDFKPFKFVVNPLFLYDAIKAITNSNFAMVHTGKGKPIEITGGQTKSIIMPIREED